LQDDFDIAYAAQPELFRESLLYARDVLAALLIETWDSLSPDYFHYTDVYSAMRRADRVLFDGLYRKIIDVNFNWREIGSATVGPQLPKEKDDDEGYRGHKDKKHKLDGLNENLTRPLDSQKPAVVADDRRNRVRRSYAERYREARMGE